ncbi:hypothetical protein [Paenibacillus aceris]|uniref:Transmembrane protein n=1 Tax=Paenibacillus aceris TaxID=869555 RepID=A0ABS4I977_9BACL|nr:hypothetical protein [Paenibacillus aceris]MBP1967031.1 hypothetical protein [Paenibacillus aceris]NHW33228.1 hypothetical protein [Paenibacillus aceris]
MLAAKKPAFIILLIITLIFPTPAFASTVAKSEDNSFFKLFQSYYSGNKYDKFDKHNEYDKEDKYDKNESNVCLGYSPDKGHDDGSKDDHYWGFWYNFCKEFLDKPICY